MTNLKIRHESTSIHLSRESVWLKSAELQKKINCIHAHKSDNPNIPGKNKSQPYQNLNPLKNYFWEVLIAAGALYDTPQLFNCSVKPRIKPVTKISVTYFCFQLTSSLVKDPPENQIFVRNYCYLSIRNKKYFCCILRNEM